MKILVRGRYGGFAQRRGMRQLFGGTHHGASGGPSALDRPEMMSVLVVGLVLRFPFSLGLDPAAFSVVLSLYHAVFSVSMSCSFLLSQLCFSCCHSVPPLSGLTTLSVSWFQTWLGLLLQPAGRGQAEDRWGLVRS